MNAVRIEEIDRINRNSGQMDPEEKKDYLKSFFQATVAVKQLEEEIELLRLDKMSPSFRYSDMPRSKHYTDMSDYMVMLEKLTDKLCSAKYKRIKLYTGISESIEAMKDETEKNLLRAKYIHLKTWDQVADVIGYEKRWTMKLHGRALKNLKLKEDIVIHC